MIKFKGFLTIDFFSTSLLGYLTTSVFLKASFFHIEMKYHLITVLFILSIQLIKFFLTPVELSENKIKGYNIFGLELEIKYEDIDAIKKKKFLITFLAFQSKKSFFSLYLPWGLDHNQAFIKALSKKQSLFTTELNNHSLFQYK